MDFTISLPEWAVVENEKLPEFVETLDERMRVVNEFARRNVEENTGGPFAAGVFERDTGRVVIVGVNRVEPMQCSSAHAEVVTLSLAQKKLGTWNLGEPGKPALQLVVNWLPCAMCLGAVLWSGVRSLAIAGLANDNRLEEITGFDEGPRVDMAKELAKRDVEFIDNGAPFPTLHPFILFLLHASFADDRSRPCLHFRFSLFCEQFSPRRPQGVLPVQEQGQRGVQRARDGGPLRPGQVPRVPTTGGQESKGVGVEQQRNSGGVSNTNNQSNSFFTLCFNYCDSQLMLQDRILPR